jgi:polygalacturonase
VLALVLLVVCAGCQSQPSSKTVGKTFDVRAFGAAGDGTTKDTAAFQKALDACAGSSAGGEIVVPAGNYLIGSLVLGSNTTLQLDKDATLTGSPDVADYPLMTIRWEGVWRDGHRALLSATNAKNVAIAGPGKIVGDTKLGHLRNPRGPCIIETIECDGVRFEGFSTQYQRMWAIHPTYCRNVVAKNLTIRSTLANGDGIDVESCSGVTIDRCDIDTGDDAIALKSGRGAEGVRIGRPTEYVTIRDCTLGSSFAGLAIGTEMSGGIRDVTFERCTFTRGSNSIFIKSRTGRGGYIRDITGRDITAKASCFLRIDLTSRGIAGADPVPPPEGIPDVSNLRFSKIESTAPTFVDAVRVDPAKPVRGLSIVNAKGTCKRAMSLANMRDVELQDVQLSDFTGPRLAIRDVEGRGLDGAVPLQPTSTTSTAPDAPADQGR